MTFIFVIMAHELTKYTHRKLTVADFQCKHKVKYALNINIKVYTQDLFITDLYNT